MKTHPLRFARPLPFFPLAAMSALCVGGTARAVIDVGSVTVPSIGHFFNPPQGPPFNFPGFVGDLLVGAGGATLNPVSINLDGDTQISFTIRAPIGQRFFVDVPDGANAVFGSSFGWRTPAGDGGGSLGFSASFQDLQGAAPTFQNNSAVGDNNQFFMFGSGSASFTNDLLFSAITLTVTYAARATGNGILTYQPFNPTNSFIEPRFSIGYQTSLTSDPGSFVSLVPFVPPANLFWGSGGASDNWSDAGNWLPNQAPANGDSLNFGFGARTTSYVDYPALSINSLSFSGGPEAYTIHVPESSTSRQLTITGSLQNFSGNSQTLIADGASAAGMNAGKLTIAGTSTSGPFTLIARGPTGSGTSGGVIELPGFSGAGSARVIIEAGAIFDASARNFGPIVGSIEGGGTFHLGHSPIIVGGNNLSTEVAGTLADGGPSGGVGASLQKVGTGTLILSGANTYTGGTLVLAGTLAVRAPSGGLGTGTVSIQTLGQVVLSQNAVAGAGSQAFYAYGSTVPGQPGGSLQFRDTASAGGIVLSVTGGMSGFLGGSASFEDSSSAGASAITVFPGTGTNGNRATLIFDGSATAAGASIINRGASASGSLGGVTEFWENASAGAAFIVNDDASSGGGGRMHFRDTSTLGTSVIVNRGVSIADTPSEAGITEFFGSSTASSGFIHNLAATAAQRAGGFTGFRETSTAGASLIFNESSGAGFAGGGHLAFTGAASAGSATIYNRGASGAQGNAGFTLFGVGTTAGNATIFNEAGLVASAPGGFTEIESTAGSALITARGSGGSANAGVVHFTGGTAATSTLTAEGATAPGGTGGIVIFNFGTTAGSAALTAGSGDAAGLAGGNIRFFGTATAGTSTIGNRGMLEFHDDSTAGAAQIFNRISPHNGDSGQTIFSQNANAGTAQIINENNGVGNASVLRFRDAASAGSATIINRGALIDDDFGSTIFEPGTTAGNATIINEPGLVEPGSTVIASSAGSASITAQGGGTSEPGFVNFSGSGSAATSTLLATGATSASGAGGRIYFEQNATAASATLSARSGLLAGAPGGSLEFTGAASGGAARATVEAGARLDISSLTVSSMTIGSIQGAGTFYLGSKELVIGGNGMSTTVTGALTNGGYGGGVGGSITKVGAGTLTLDGINSYTGTTRVLEGILNIDSPLPPNAVLLAMGGVLNVNGDVMNGFINVQPTGGNATVNITGDVSGSSIAVIPILGTATVNITRSEQLASLNIGDGGVVVLTEPLLPAPDAVEFDAGSALATPAVPEPGIGALLASALALLAARRRNKEPRFPNRETHAPRSGLFGRQGGGSEGMALRGVGSAIRKSPLLATLSEISSPRVARSARGTRM